MNRVPRLLALLNLNNNPPFYLKASFFHSTPVLDRRRRNYWESDARSYRNSSRRPNFNGRRQRKFYAKQELLRNFNAYAENLFQGCYNRDEYEPSSSHRNSWFRNLNNGPRRFNGARDNSKARKKGYQFYEDDDEDVETIFRSTFGSNAGFYFYTFINDELPRGSSGFNYNNNNRSSWNWRRQFEEDVDDDDDDADSERVDTDIRKERIALGLSGSGSLSLEDVKNAYRACALKWHPDRHNGSSKADAEEKFKVCSAAYQSLCDKLAPN